MSDEAKKNFRVIVADDDGQLSRRLMDFLKDRNFDVKMVNGGKELKTLLGESWIPHFVVSDLMLPDLNAIELCSIIKNNPNLKDTKVLVTSGHNSVQNVKDCLKAGASDYVIKPFKLEDMLSRLVFHIQKKRQVAEATAEDKSQLTGGDLYLHLLDLVLKEATSFKKLNDTLYNLTKMMAITLKAVRCNIVECSEDRQIGLIRASSDDRAAQGIQIDLNRYPEILHVMNTEKVVVIENLESDPVMSEIKKSFKNISFNSLIVCPIKKRGRFYGVLAARMGKDQNGFTDRDIRFALLLSHIVTLSISSDLPIPIELLTPAA